MVILFTQLVLIFAGKAAEEAAEEMTGDGDSSSTCSVIHFTIFCFCFIMYNSGLFYCVIASGVWDGGGGVFWKGFHCIWLYACVEVYLQEGGARGSKERVRAVCVSVGMIGD